MHYDACDGATDPRRVAPRTHSGDLRWWNVSVAYQIEAFGMTFGSGIVR